MGRTQCFRANAAYTLYGIARGGEIPDQHGTPCNSGNYINSFFTNYGIEEVINVLGIDGYSYGVTSDCGISYAGESNSTYKHTNQLYPDSRSYTTACTAEGTLATTQFVGAYCNGQAFDKILDSMDDINAELANFSSNVCVQVYSNGEDYADDQYGDSGSGTASRLLHYSIACNIFEYPRRCPDPFGLKRAMDTRMAPISSSWISRLDLFHWTRMLFFTLVFAGIILHIMAHQIDGDVKEMRQRRKRRTKELEKRGQLPTMNIKERLIQTKEYFVRNISLISFKGGPPTSP